ncbi:MAG: caspase family protein, partial [Myxococcota bacterium]
MQLLVGVVSCILFDLGGSPRALAGEERALTPEKSASASERNVALVIGNGAYEHAQDLRQAPVDARNVASALERLGFEGRLVVDATDDRMKKAVDEFRGALDGGAVGFFYYSGHGIQVDGENYLVPVDAELRFPELASSETLVANKVVAAMTNAGSELNVMVLDACRNNPWIETWPTRGVADRNSATSRGLQQMTAPVGAFLIAFATEPGDVAADSGIYANALVRRLSEPCIELPRAFGRVFDDVVLRTGQAGGPAQRPWFNIAGGDVAFSRYLAGCQQPPPPPPPPPAPPEGALVELVWVPGGTFTMGSPPTERGHFDDEGPVHPVSVDGL